MPNTRDSIPAARTVAFGPLSCGTVHVWFLDRLGPLDPRWIDVLDAEERARASAFRSPEQRESFTASHALVRTALSTYGACAPADWRFGLSPEGRPLLLGDSGLRFSLTHSGTWAAVAIGAGQAIGLDIEPVRPERDALPLARRFFGAEETERLGGLPPGERPAGFARLWTVKEAVLKARGCGLTEPLRSVEVDLDPSGQLVRVEAPGGPWAVRSWLPEPGWCAALAVSTENPLSVASFRARPLGRPFPAPELGPDPSRS